MIRKLEEITVDRRLFEPCRLRMRWQEHGKSQPQCRRKRVFQKFPAIHSIPLFFYLLQFSYEYPIETGYSVLHTLQPRESASDVSCRIIVFLPGSP